MDRFAPHTVYVGGGLTRYHTPVMPSPAQGGGGGWQRFATELSHDLQDAAVQGAKQGAKRGLKKGGFLGLPNISGAFRGAKTGAVQGVKTTLKRKAHRGLDRLHATSKKKLDDLFSG